jgi:hypothetical protein
MQNNIPTAFISYSWDSDAHKVWVRDFASRLRNDGVETILDQWEVVPGSQMPSFMEASVRDNDFVLIICTPRYKTRSDSRKGGVGYEGDIMTSEILNTRNHAKFIPILRTSKWNSAAPSWLLGKAYIDLSEGPYDENQYARLVSTLHGELPTPPPVKVRKQAPRDTSKSEEAQEPSEVDIPHSDISLVGVITHEVGVPSMDGTAGSSLYSVPFRLSTYPTSEWKRIFISTWNSPPRYTTMHRPGIAEIRGDRLILDGTTIEEVEKYHIDTLKIVLRETNSKYSMFKEMQRKNAEKKANQVKAHKDNVDDVAERLKFDDE